MQCSAEKKDGNQCQRKATSTYDDLNYCGVHFKRYREKIKIEESRQLIESLKGFYIHEIDRTDLRRDIEKYWVNDPDSNIGIGTGVNLDKETGLIDAKKYIIWRQDIFHIGFSNGDEFIHIFVKPNLSYSGRREIETTVEYFDIYIKKYLPIARKEFYDRQLKWYNDCDAIKNRIHEKPPKEAVEIIKEMGW